MKKIFFVPLAILLLCCGCVTDNVVEENRLEIAYHVTTNNQSRALDSYSPNNLPPRFQVWAKNEHGKSYFGPDVIVNRNGAWVDQTASRYWPRAEKLSFYGLVNLPDNVAFYYENTDSEDNADTTTNPYIHGFTVKDNVEDQVDLMYAVAAEVPYSASGVPMNFHHALSQVAFQSRNNTSNLTITISEVVVGTLYNKADYTLPSSSTISGGDPIGTWSSPVLNNGENYSGTGGDAYNNKVEYKVALSTSVVLTSIPETSTAEETGGAGTSTEGTTYNLTSPAPENNDWSKVLTLLPQKQKAWDPTVKAPTYNGAYFKLKVVIEDEKDDTGNGATLYDGYAVIPANIDWEEGNRYIYTFIFDKDTNGGYTDTPDDPQPVLTTVTYQVKVEDFTPVNEDGNMHDPDEPTPPTPEDPKPTPGANVVLPPDATGTGY